jgi:hypothetical protein
MLVAKCSACKNKTTLQACEVCEEAKCVECAQQHLKKHRSELKRQWLAFEIKYQSVKPQIGMRIRRSVIYNEAFV